eukprot:TRINITY_DN7858_c0_g1_i1.p1 TRINITY_DN7858_c0_g1~~TRINITY_DN7858_c0_g1_i1.p1  ORF type:complete len:687 (+),score=195.02 TRINITY_DN7858_c0_g1_i1:114-2174(+)
MSFSGRDISARCLGARRSATRASLAGSAASAAGEGEASPDRRVAAGSRLAYRSLAAQQMQRGPPAHSIDSDPLRKQPAAAAAGAAPSAADAPPRAAPLRRHSGLFSRAGLLGTVLGGGAPAAAGEGSEAQSMWSGTTGGLTDEAAETATAPSRPASQPAPRPASAAPDPARAAAGRRTPGLGELPARALRQVAALAADSAAGLLAVAQVCQRWRRVCQQDAALWLQLPPSVSGPCGAPPTPGWAVAGEQCASRHPLAALRRGAEPLRRAQLQTVAAPCNSVASQLLVLPVSNSAALQIAVTADAKGEVQLRDPGRLSHVLAAAEAHSGSPIAALAAHDRGRSRWLLTASGAETAVLEVPKLGGAACMAVSRRGVVDWGRVKLGLKVVHRLGAHHSAAVSCLCGHPAQPIVATGSVDRTVALWDLSQGSGAAAPRAVLRRHSLAVSAVVPASGAVLASGGRDGLCCLWSWDGQLLRAVGGHRGPVVSLAPVVPPAQARPPSGGGARAGYSSRPETPASAPGGGAQRAVVSVCGGGMLRWAAAAGAGPEWSSELPLGKDAPTPTALCVEGDVACVGAVDGSIALVRLSDGRTAALRGHQGAVRALQLDAAREWLVSGGDDGRVLLWSYARWAADPAVDAVRPSNTLGESGGAVTALAVVRDRQGVWRRVLHTTADRRLVGTELQFGAG